MQTLSSKTASGKIDLAAIKARLPDYLANIGEVKDVRGKLVICCPLHEDWHPSLSAQEKDGAWVWFCHPCGIGGSVIDLHMKRTGLAESEAIRELAVLFNAPSVQGIATRPVAASKPKATRYAPTDAEYARAAVAAQTLGLNAKLCEQIAKARSWKPETIQRLAAECSLGWEDGKAAFIYSTGMKLRWREGDKRRFAFAFGKPHSLWREHMREPGFDGDGATVRVIITEGETDAIRLIDLGLDSLATRIMAVPSASTWPLDAEEKLRGLREVIFAPDNDDAGQAHVAEWCALVTPYVPSVRVLNWKNL
jgi:DNA primase